MSPSCSACARCRSSRRTRRSRPRHTRAPQSAATSFRKIADRGRLRDVQRIAARAARRRSQRSPRHASLGPHGRRSRRIWDIAAIDRPFDCAASEVDNVVVGLLFTVAAIDVARNRAAVDGDGIAIRCPVRRQAACDEAVHGRANADRDVVLRGIACHAVRADGAALHLALYGQGVVLQLRRIRLVLRQGSDGAPVGIFACANRDPVPRVFRVILHDDDVFVRIVFVLEVVREGFFFRDIEDEIVAGILCHGARDGAVDGGQVDGIRDVRGNQLAVCFLEQIDFFSLLEVSQEAARADRHVALADLRIARVRKSEKRISILRSRRERERILHAIDLHHEALAVLRQRARRRCSRRVKFAKLRRSKNANSGRLKFANLSQSKRANHKPELFNEAHP